MLELQQFSTEVQLPSRRIEYWNAVTGAALTTHTADPVDPKAFCGRMTSLDLGDIRMVELNASGSTVTHSRAHVGRSPQALYLVRLVLRGDIGLTQQGREVRLRAGDFALCDTSRPYQLFFREPSNVLIIRIPRDRIFQYIGRPEAMIAIRMEGSEGLSGLASRHLRETWAASREFLTCDASSRMSEITLQLLASAYSGLPQSRADASCVAIAHRARIIEYIERNLSVPDLDPPKIASSLGIALGSLHRLFRAEADTVSRYILRRRLEECARSFRDPAQSGCSITSIAFSFGFNSLPHFSRVFRERYAASPKEYRHGVS